MDKIGTRNRLTRCSFAIHSFVQNLSQIGQEIAEEFDNTHTHTHKKKFSHLVICIDVQTTAIEVTTSSSDVADEEQFFFTHTDDQDEIEE